MTAHTQLPPDRDMLAQFSAAMFKHAGTEGYVSLRAFYEDDAAKPFRITPVSMKGGLPFLIEAVEDDANRAANHPRKVVFCPPIAIYGKRDRAREGDILEGPALSVEYDQRPREARATLEGILGPATLVVRSGGAWTDPETGEVCDKLHLHWRLRIPARGDDLATLKQARDLAARLVGGDPSNKPVCHPIRWPGSWHRKGEPRLCEIETATEHEIDLAIALAELKKAAPATASGSGNANGQDATPATDWAELVSGIVTGSNYHGAEIQLASKMVTAGMADGAVVNMLRGMMESSTAPRDARWQARYDDIPRSVSTAREKYGTTSAPQPASPIASDPVDLWAKFEPPTLPRGLLPDVIERFAYDQGTTMGADMAGVAVGALVVCGAAIPDEIKLQVKRNDPSWRESARLWAAIVGPVSAKKSPIMSSVVRPLRRIDSEMARRYSEERAKYDRLPAEERKQTDPPRQTRLLLQDTTIEAAQDILKDSPDGVLSFQDELSGWFGSMDKYSGSRGAAKDRAFWLEAYNGGSYSVTRVSRGAVFIENLSVSILGGIQPEPIRKIADESMDDGLFQRLLPVVLRPAVEGRDEPQSDVVAEYSALINRLHSLADKKKNSV